MRKIFFEFGTSTCGTDGTSVVEYDDSVTNEELDEDAWLGALDNAAMYGIYPRSDMDESDEDYNEDDYDDDIYGTWEEYDPEKHEGRY